MFDFDIHYKKGKLNCEGDYTSRLHSDGHAVAEVDVDLPCNFIESKENAELSTVDLRIANLEELPKHVEALQTEEILREQHEDELCQNISKAIENGHNPLFRPTDDGLIIRTATPSSRASFRKAARSCFAPYAYTCYGRSFWRATHVPDDAEDLLLAIHGR